jgi:hypothetical protein
MYGWGKDGGWVNLGVWPMEENSDSEAVIVPVDCLTEEEKSALGCDTASSASNASGDITDGGGNVLSFADLITYFASKEDVEAGDIDGALAFLVGLLQPARARRFKSRLFFGISGYDEDSRELFQIPEVRLWMRELDVAFPYWFYFLSKHAATMEFVTFSLCDYVEGPSGALIAPAVLADFASRHFAAMNSLFEKLGESEDAIEKLTKEIEAFFFEEHKAN